MFFSITQQIPIPIDPHNPGGATVPFRGGCTLVLDLDSGQLLYRIAKPINDPERLQNEMDYLHNNGSGSCAPPTSPIFVTGTEKEPFAQLHRGD